ncbi:unnamed protein product, partial [Meganyctiphanes norvegica]
VPSVAPDVLVYNVSGSVGEHVLGAWLHGDEGGSGRVGGSSRRGDGRPTRYILYHLQQPEDPAKPPRYTDPLVTITVKDDKQEVEVTRAVHEAVLGAGGGGRLLGVRVEELRHGRFHSKDPNKINKWSPLLLVYSSDPAMLDLEALGLAALNISHKGLDFNSYKNINAHLNPQHGQNDVRSRRSIGDWTEFKELFKDDRLKSDFLLLSNSLDNDALNTNSISSNTVGSSSSSRNKSMRNSSKSGNRHDPLLSNLINNNLLAQDDLSDEDSDIVSSSRMNISRKKSKTGDEFTSNDLPSPLGHSKPEVDSSSSEEKTGSRRHRRRRKHRKHHKKDNLIPLPDDYTKSKMDSGEKKTKRKNKKRKHRRIPVEWMNAAQDKINNEASNSINPMGPGLTSTGASACGRQELTVDFQALGWDRWIVAPPSFMAHYCAGSCPNPLTKSLSGSNHAIIQSLIHSLGTHPQVPAPCCVPDKLDSISILSFDDEERFVLKNYPKMTVTSCSCQ